MKEKDCIDRLFEAVDSENDELLDMQIDFADKYLPDDKEDTKRRIQAECMLCNLIIANKREAFRAGFKAAERLHKGEVNA